MGVELAVMGAMTAVGGLAMGANNKVSAPPKRSYLGEMSEALKAQKSIFPEVLKAEREFLPQFQDLQKFTLMGQINTLGSLYKEAIPVADQIGKDILAQQRPMMRNITKASQDLYNRAMGDDATGIMNALQARGLEYAKAGRSLTPEDQMYAQQAARTAAAAQGMSYGNQAIAGEVLNNYNVANQREQMRLNYATAAYGLQQGAVANAMSTYGAPLSQALATSNPNNLIGVSQQMASALGPTLFNPESQMNADINSANQANEMNARLANQQAKAGMAQGLMSFGGSMLSAGLGYQGTIDAANIKKFGTPNPKQ